MTDVTFATPDDHAREAPGIVRHLQQGGLITYPTETVYGLGCALIPDALEQLARLKQRNDAKAFILLVLDQRGAGGLLWTPAAQALAEAFWPGALTLVLSVLDDRYPRRVVSQGRVAVRATPHSGVRSILDALGGPLTSTSANTPGQPPAASAVHARLVLQALAAPSSMWLLDAGQLPPSAPSTIVDCARGRPRLVRAGAIKMDELKNVFEEIDA